MSSARRSRRRGLGVAETVRLRRPATASGIEPHCERLQAPVSTPPSGPAPVRPSQSPTWERHARRRGKIRRAAILQTTTRKGGLGSTSLRGCVGPRSPGRPEGIRARARHEEGLGCCALRQSQAPSRFRSRHPAGRHAMECGYRTQDRRCRHHGRRSADRRLPSSRLRRRRGDRS